MRNSKIPKTIQRWLDANAWRIDDYHMEEDEFCGDPGQSWSIWVYLKPGWINQSLEAHLIHESYVKDFMAHAAEVVPCQCDDCDFELSKLDQEVV